MTVQRDFLVANPPVAVGSNLESLTALMAEQSDYLQNIAHELHKQNPDVLAQVVVDRTSPYAKGTVPANTIVDTVPHRVYFVLGGKPVAVHNILFFSSYNQTVSVSVVQQSNVLDGIPFVAGNMLVLPITVSEVYIMAPVLSAAQLRVNGGADPVNGGFYIYGFTVPDYDRVRGARRS